MIYRVLSEIKVKTGQGEMILTPGQIIRLDPVKANPLIESGKLKQHKPLTEKKASAWENPHSQGTPEARRQSLQEVMTAITLTAKDRIIEAHKGRQYKATNESRKAEQNIERLQHEVFNGQANLSDFREATERWARIYVKEI